MNRKMKAALDAALKDILSLSPEEFLKEARECREGDVFSFLKKSEKFKDFDVSTLEPLSLHFSEVMTEDLVTLFSTVKLNISNSLNIDNILVIEEEPEFALAA
ncbi:hypothetical protein ACP7HA_003004 [Klebsiella pneumoniae]|uniref:hypothetical protein n=1 Tax=Klebsiella pneumoniae complex TaxID=3390273 RepID=UPI0007EC205B|nr:MULTISPECIES: hypothetical protein [Klebsiella]ANK40692.1 hypothetical protein WM91_06490 [Klebsiella pneumoniae]EIX9167112.1 hypothetical protein [Klebsiella pneumoniae]EKZ5519249.1 hypothetical protein [Klebsiella pneumoniae]EKZ5528246.1 hypothetical protein [Klebsiella pneumoniae]ELB7278756.1 hypothetical protein [Klebsiella pneumoniae]